MGVLSEICNTVVTYKGRQYKTNPAYDIVLAIQNLMGEEDVSDTDKLDCALSMLCKSGTSSLSLKDKAGLLREIYKSQINLPKKMNVGKQVKLVDFELDGEYIYASFYKDYGIDLLEQQGKLHWKKFIWLFQGLSKDTKIKEIMRIREMDIPEPNNYNQKERQSIMELKAYYQLPVSTNSGKSGIEGLFHTLESVAKHGK